MKKRFKNWITTVLGFIIMALGCFLFFFKEMEILRFIISIVVGFGFFMDNKIHEFILTRFKK